MLYPTQYHSTDLSDYKNSKAYSRIILVGFSHYIFTKYLEVNTAFSKENVDSLNHKSKNLDCYGKIWPLHMYGWIR